ncbi:YdcF family protein [Beijerinckiaceae bacterium RH AL1]|nr:YdcF family protein [Beijerinckiaceae bacterium]VVB44955.1 YdcF family protein [Beijerinckiaceae bacterium RH CH11]VVB45034.1 YdcF family protein [Beijerinckiaceae bacterium RH AL8]VVC54623.1 YdcF family protein [Beijerinckiaceae bacterium RH AL1]
MFFIASKIIGVVLEPIAFLVLVGFAGIALATIGFARTGRVLSLGAALAFAIVCFSPLGNALLRPLEDRFPQPPAEMAAPAGIVVLGGALDEGLTAARGQPSLNEAAGRLTAGVELARRFPSARLVFTGGSADLSQKADLDEARGVHALWLTLGVPDSRMTFESASRNTYENAVLTKKLVAPKPGETWLLVTSAAHMPRSVGIFRAAGWPVVAYPVDYRTSGTARDWWPSAKVVDQQRKVEVAGHEWIGLVAYRLTGKTATLFPAP